MDADPAAGAIAKKVAVMYATREGQTRRIAERLATQLRGRGLTVDVLDVGSRPAPPCDLARYSGALLAASVHIGKHEKSMIDFVKAHRAELERMPSAFVSVSLAKASADNAGSTPERREGAASHVAETITRFVRETGWSPKRVHAVAGALLYRQYGVLVRVMMRFIATRAGAATDTSRDHEYTDWQAVDRIGDEFAPLVRSIGT
jgi:menaquinone-dependent protoporphyrinogen oxidase